MELKGECLNDQSYVMKCFTRLGVLRSVTRLKNPSPPKTRRVLGPSSCFTCLYWEVGDKSPRQNETNGRSNFLYYFPLP